ncbi:hypothetical protein CEXT_63731 [Caerostris extrusa]|uniref:Uncharacterized protein n=1 Tax=Caerostris extrusa TaxID=172846 RepID=A0AAV4TXU4_CAEEX|nr:hypothetical protein CEXT_63731 [Caerostris extrusa]
MQLLFRFVDDPSKNPRCKGRRRDVSNISTACFSSGEIFADDTIPSATYLTKEKGKCRKKGEGVHDANFITCRFPEEERKKCHRRHFYSSLAKMKSIAALWRMMKRGFHFGVDASHSYLILKMGSIFVTLGCLRIHILLFNWENKYFEILGSKSKLCSKQQ